MAYVCKDSVDECDVSQKSYGVYFQPILPQIFIFVRGFNFSWPEGRPATPQKRPKNWVRLEASTSQARRLRRTEPAKCDIFRPRNALYTRLLNKHWRDTGFDVLFCEWMSNYSTLNTTLHSILVWYKISFKFCTPKLII